MRLTELEQDLHYLKMMLHYIGCIEERLVFAKKLGLADNDEMVIDSLAMNLGQVGEQLAQDKLSNTTRQRYDDVDWKAMKRFRNLAYHDYGAVRVQPLLRTIYHDLPKIKERLERIVADLQRDLSDK